MAVTSEDVRKIAQLSKLTFKDEEIEKFTHQMNEILDYMEQLNEVDTDTIEPLFHVIEPGNVLRDDTVGESSPREDMLKNAPQKSEEFIIVPRIIE